MLHLDLVHELPYMRVLFKLLCILILHFFYSFLLAVLKHVFLLLSINCSLLAQREKFWLFQKHGVLEREVLIVVDGLRWLELPILVFAVLHEVIELGLFMQLFLDGIRHEGCYDGFQLGKLGWNALDCHKCLLRSSLVQLLVGFLVIVVNVWRAVVPLLQVSFKPLVLFVLDRILNLLHFLPHILVLGVKLVDIVLQSDDFFGLLVLERFDDR